MLTQRFIFHILNKSKHQPRNKFYSSRKKYVGKQIKSQFLFTHELQIFFEFFHTKSHFISCLLLFVWSKYVCRIKQKINSIKKRE